MAVKAGGSTDPDFLISAAAPYQVLAGNQLAVQVYLLAQLAGVATDPITISGYAQCGPCIPGDYRFAVNADLWSVIAGTTFDPTAPIPTSITNFLKALNYQSAIQTLLLNNLASTGQTPAQLATSASCLSCLTEGVLEMAYTSLLCAYLNKSSPPANLITWAPDTVGGTYNGGIPFANLAAFRALTPSSVTSLSLSAGVTSISNVPTLTNLVSLAIAAGTYATLDVSGMANLNAVTLTSATGLTSFSVTGDTQLASISITNATGLTSITGLNGAVTPVSSLTLTNVGIVGLSFSGNSLMTASITSMASMTSLNLSNCASLNNLVITSDTALTTLNISNCTGLQTLNGSTCGNINTLTLTGCNQLQVLQVQNNKLATLNLTDCVNLYAIDASHNVLTSFVPSSSPVTPGGPFSLTFNDNKLATMALANYVSSDYDDCLLFNNLLTQAGVDSVLTTLAGSGNTGNICDCSGTGNATPSAAGINAKNTMIANGWYVVNTN